MANYQVLSAIIAVTLVGCSGNGDLPIDPDTEAEADLLEIQPLLPDTTVDRCDVDGDGFTAQSCGGQDCDDEDASRYPGALELLGEDDLNCDGLAGYTLQVEAMPQGLAPLGWSWSPSLDNLGGTLRDLFGLTAGYTLSFQDDGSLFDREILTYGYQDPITAEPSRVWTGLGPVDLLPVSDGLGSAVLVADQEGVVNTLERGPADFSDLDVLYSDGMLRVLTCGGGRLELFTVGYDEPVRPGYDAIDSEAYSCALFQPGGQLMSLSIEEDGDMVRWDLSGGGIGDSLRLATDVFPDQILATAAGDQGFLVLDDDGQLTALSYEGFGVPLGQREQGGALAAQVDEQGNLAVVWDDGQGLVLSYGSLATGFQLFPLSVDHPVAGLTVGLRADQVAVAAWSEDQVSLVRAVR